MATLFHSNGFFAEKRNQNKTTKIIVAAVENSKL